MATATTTPITVEKIDLGTMKLRLIGDSPLICHAWSEKAKQMILDKQMKKGKQAKEAKDPERDYLESLYHHPDGGYGFPTTGIKAAAVSAARFTDQKMTEIRGAFHVLGEMARIDGEPEPREDMVRVGMGTADIRYRGQFPTWSIDIDVRFNRRAISPDQIINLFNVAGFGVGIGEWRPEKDGQYGRFHVANTEEISL